VQAEARLPVGLRKDMHIAAILEIPTVRERWTTAKGHAPTSADVDVLFADFVPMQLACLSRYTTLIPGTVSAVKTLQKELGLKIGSTTGFTKARGRGAVIVCRPKNDIALSSHAPWELPADRRSDLSSHSPDHMPCDRHNPTNWLCAPRAGKFDHDTLQWATSPRAMAPPPWHPPANARSHLLILPLSCRWDAGNGRCATGRSRGAGLRSRLLSGRR